MPDARRNNRLVQSLPQDLLPNKYAAWHEPFGDFGIWNGQFEQPSPPDADMPVTAAALAGPYYGPEGWEAYTYSNGVVERSTAQRLAGEYSYRGGQAGMGAGGQIVSLKYFPVDQARDYMLTASFYGTNVAATKFLGCVCYDVNKAVLATVPVLNWTATNPAATWTRNWGKIGPNGSVAWPANTAYARVICGLNNNAALTGHYVYVDDVQFQQLKFADSTGIRLLMQTCSDATGYVFTGAGTFQHVGSPMVLTVPEPAVIWISYEADARNNTATRVTSWAWQPYIGGVAIGFPQIFGATLLHRQPYQVWTYTVQPAGTYTIDLRITVYTAGDQIGCFSMAGFCYWTRYY